MAGLLLLLSLSACATNPVTGRPMLALVSEAQEVALGQKYAPEIANTMGLYDDPALQRYVESVGMPMARASERPDLPWQFRVVDDAAVNAFAVPGGFLYVTRGILAHMGSEAELASVLGHEIGHVTARHSVSQLSKQQLAQLGVLVGSVALGSDMQQLLPIASQGLQLLFLKYGRDDERQADDLGLRYMTAARYDPNEMVEMFRTLGRQRPEGTGRTPEWLATHPDPENREARIAAAIRETGASGNVVKRAEFLQHLDGMAYGPDPRAGFFVEQVFHHPSLAFRMDFPTGWKLRNQPDAVLGMSAEQDALVQLSMVGAATVDDAAGAFFAQQGVEGGRPQRGVVHGLQQLRNDFRVTTNQGQFVGVVAFVEYAGSVYQLLGYGPAEGFAARRDVVLRSLSSFRQERDAAVLAVEPWRIGIVTPSRAMTPAEFARVYPGPVSAEELARINELDEGGVFTARVPAKRVRGKALPGAR